MASGASSTLRSHNSRLFAAHPLQVHARRNQLESLLVAVSDGELLHTRWTGPTRCAAAHVIRAWCWTLVEFQIWKVSVQLSVGAVLRPEPLDLFLTLLPVHARTLPVSFLS